MSRFTPLLCLLLVACTSSGYAPMGRPEALVASDGIITLRDEDGKKLPITPDSRLQFETDQGWTEPVVAARLCRLDTELGFRTGDSCASATPFVPYDAIKGVQVETMDRAGTVAIVSAVSIVVLGVLALVLSDSDSKNKSSSSSSSSPSIGGGGGHRSSGGGGSYHYERHHRDDGVAIATNLAANAIVSAGETPDGPTAETALGASFTNGEIRRASVSVLASVDATASAFARDGISSGLHGGVRLFNLLDLQAGVRFLEGGRSIGEARAVATGKIGLHGEFPRARWIALGLSFEAGAGSAVDLYLDARFGVRLAPVRNLWLGLYPIHPSYVNWSHGRGDHWVPQSSFDLALGF